MYNPFKNLNIKTTFKNNWDIYKSVENVLRFLLFKVHTHCKINFYNFIYKLFL